MDGHYDDLDDWASPGHSMDTTHEEKEEMIRSLMDGDMSYWLKPKTNVTIIETPVRKPVNLPLASKTDKQFEGAVEKRHDSSYLMRNIASADKEKTGVLIISEEERKKYVQQTPDEFDEILESEEYKNLNSKQRKALKRGKEIEKRSFTRPNEKDKHFPVLGQKKRLTPETKENDMEQTNQTMYNSSAVRHSEPAVQAESVAEKLSKLTMTGVTAETIEPETHSYSGNSISNVPLPDPSIPIKDGVADILKRQFESIGYDYHGFAVLKRETGICYSVSFSEKHRKPDWSQNKEILANLSNLAFEDYLIYGLREFMTLIPKVPAPLHRWQVVLEKLHEDDDRREEQMVYQLTYEDPIPLANSYFRPSTEQTIEFEDPIEQVVQEADDSASSGDEAKPVGGKSKIAKMKALCREDPNKIVNSTRGPITVSQWIQDWKDRRKRNKQMKKNPPVENAREEAGEVSSVESEASTVREKFSDDSIPKDVGGTIKQKIENAVKAKKNPEKVVGQRVWEAGKGMITTETFSRTLASGLVESKQVKIWVPEPVVRTAVSKPKYARCPIPGFPLGVWRKYDTKGKTSEEVLEIAKKAFSLFVRSEVAYLRNRWVLSKQRGANPWLSSPKNIIIAFCDNDIDSWWLAYQSWHEKAVAYVSHNATEEQKKWGVKQNQTKYESD